MKKFFTTKKNNKISNEIEKLNQHDQACELACSYDGLLAQVKELFAEDDIIKIREFSNKSRKNNYCVVYCNGLVNTTLINEHIIKPLMLAEDGLIKSDPLTEIMTTLIQVSEVKKITACSDLIQGVTYGDTLLFTDGGGGALMIDTKDFTTRAVSEPDAEKIIVGPREGFTESLMVNLSLVRRKLRTNHLKMKVMQIGKETQTQLCVAYLDNIVNKYVLQELLRRLEKINLDGVLDANYINELVRDDAWSPFRTIGETERPDVAVGRMLEGRIAIFVDGSPMVLTAPFLFIENFQSSEDYYLDFYEATFSRILRIAAFLIAVIVPGLYIAIVAFHHEVLPSTLLISIAYERINAPLPASLEALCMLLLFYILREAALRMPSNVGQAMSIVGALVLGQAAVEAKLVAAPMIIVVAITGITSLLISKLTSPIIIATLGILGLATVFGILGVTLGISILCIHILGLHSFGISEMTRTQDLRLQQMKDTFVRAPWWNMLMRPNPLTKNLRRQQNIGEEH